MQYRGSARGATSRTAKLPNYMYNRPDVKLNPGPPIPTHYFTLRPNFQIHM